MAKKKKDAPSPKLPAAKAVAPTRGLDPRILIYGVIDLALIALYLYLLLFAAPNRHFWAQLILTLIPLFAVVMAVGTVAGAFARATSFGKIGWWMGIAGGAGMLVVMVVVLGFLLASAAFLSGVYGAFGKAAAGGILGAMALIVEIVAIVPVLQLKFLMTRGGRRAFGLPPVWAAR
jgi:hypothetical protein